MIERTARQLHRSYYRSYSIFLCFVAMRLSAQTCAIECTCLENGTKAAVISWFGLILFFFMQGCQSHNLAIIPYDPKIERTIWQRQRDNSEIEEEVEVEENMKKNLLRIHCRCKGPWRVPSFPKILTSHHACPLCRAITIYFHIYSIWLHTTGAHL
jgi:hypothetical protein